MKCKIRPELKDGVLTLAMHMLFWPTALAIIVLTVFSISYMLGTTAMAFNIDWITMSLISETIQYNNPIDFYSKVGSKILGWIIVTPITFGVVVFASLAWHDSQKHQLEWNLERKLTWYMVLWYSIFTCDKDK